MVQEQTIEELEQSIEMLSFEDELTALDSLQETVEKEARIVTCRVCGKQTLVGPEDIFSCSCGPHDPEDDNDK